MIPIRRLRMCMFLLLLAVSVTLAADPAAEGRPTRDPFWPIGYRPVGAPAPRSAAGTNAVSGAIPPAPLLDLTRLTAQQKTAISEQLVASGYVVTGQTREALINGNWCPVGAECTVHLEGVAVVIRITSITNDSFEWAAVRLGP